MAGSDTQKQHARADLDAYVAEAQAFFQSLDPKATDADFRRQTALLTQADTILGGA